MLEQKNARKTITSVWYEFYWLRGQDLFKTLLLKNGFRLKLKHQKTVIINRNVTIFFVFSALPFPIQILHINTNIESINCKLEV